MKAQMLKIAGVKTEKAFYKKYPTEAAFFKAHPEAKKLVKAQVGAYIGGETPAIPEMISFQEQFDVSDKMITGSTQADRDKMAYDQVMLEALQTKNNDKGTPEQAAKYGTHIPKAQWGAVSSFLSGANNLKPEFGYYDSNYSPFETGYNQTFAGPKPNASNIGSLLQPQGAKNFNIPQPTADVPSASEMTAEKGSFDIMQGLPIVGGVMGALNAFGAQKKARQSAEQAQRVSEIALKASTTRPEQIKRKYVTPWDNPVQPGQMFPVYGVGTNVLNAKDGAEIQNTYAPGTLYDDLGYEPLNDSSQAKQYYHGGEIPKALFGIENLGGTISEKLGGFGLASAGGAGFGANPYGAIAGGLFGNNAGSQMGGAVGSIFGRGGGVAGSVIGGALDNAFGDGNKAKKAQRATERNIQNMAMNNMAPGIQAGYASHMEDGGYLSHDYNPQVIAKFGGLDEQDFYDYAHDGMDSLRSGGHLKGEYTPVSARGLQTYAMGGELKTHWGGHAETMSHNPFLPGDGETVMFRGQSHDESDGKGNTGIGITYGNSPVEVERGEPAVKLKDGGTNEENLTVYGNLQIPNEYLPVLDDPRAKGKKFKNYVALISKDEAKQNKTIEKSTSLLDALEVKTPFDKLKFDALTANINGANMKLKDIADKKINAAHLQNAINDTAEEYGLVADDLAKGKAKFNPEAQEGYAKTGKTITTTNKTTSFPSEKDAKDSGYLWTGKYDEKGKKIYKIKAKISSASSKESNTAEAMDYIPKQSLDKNTGLYGGVTPEQFEEFKNKNQWYPKFKDNTFDPNNPDHVDDLAKAFNAKAEAIGSSARILPDDKKTGKTKYVGKQVVSANLNKTKTSTPGEDVEDYATIDETDNRFKTTDYKRSKWMDIANQIIPFIRPTDQEPLDPNQLMGEMYALSNNQVEPVQAQSYQPDLGTPYDISYQDMLNANQADYNATQKMLGYNPSGLAQLNAQKYAANEKVLGEQFRQNQAMKAGVYDKNRDILNDAKLKNLQIYDQQYTRQSQAVSNTKAIAQAALNSISDKYAKNKAANRELGVYENMYNYRFDPAGRAINMNPFMQPNLPTMYGKQTDPNILPVYDANGKQTGWKKVDDKQITTSQETTDAYTSITPNNSTNPNKNGGSTKKSFLNGSIVKSYKSI